MLRLDKLCVNLSIQKANFRRDTSAFVILVMVLRLENIEQWNGNVQTDFKIDMWHFYDADQEIPRSTKKE